MDAYEIQLVEQAIRGDIAAFGFLVQRYYNWVLSIAFREVKNLDDAQDITQDVFMVVFRKLSQLREPARFELWLRIVTNNHCRMWRRRYIEHSPLEDIPQDFQLPETYPERDSEINEMLLEALKSLSESNQLIMKLHYMDDMSYKEIASYLELPVTTVEMRLHRARAQLREGVLDTAKSYFVRKKRRAKRALLINGSLIDPETGLKYTRFATISGEKDIIEYPTGLNLSSDGRFLLWGITVIPLGDEESFDLIDFFGARGTWSPDMKKIVFYSNGIWMIPVSPETGKPVDTAKKILEGEYWYQHNVNWSPDSTKIAFTRDNNIWSLSIEDGKLTQITRGPGLKIIPLWSPDGNTIAYTQDYTSIYLSPSYGGEPGLLIDAGRHIAPVGWIDEGQWLLCGEGTTLGTNLSLINTQDGYVIPANPPLEAGKFLAVPQAACLSKSGREVLFYRLSYDYRSTLKVIPSSGGSPTEFGRELTLWPYTQSWTPDNKVIITDGEDSNGKFISWAIPFMGGRPIMVDIKIPEIEKPVPYSLSPDCKKLLFSVEKGKNTEELWVAQFSTECYHATVPATMIFIWEERHPGEEAIWSPDGNYVAIMHRGEIWVLPVDGSPPYQLTKPPGWKYNPVWSSDGQTIAYNLFLPDRKGGIYIIPASGGEEREVLGTPGSYRSKYIFSKNGKELLIINNELLIMGISVADGESRNIADLREFDINQAHSLSISPDGKEIACVGWNRPENEFGAIYVIPINGGKIRKLASEDTGYKESITWSPDGKWISYCSDLSVKTRPQGIIWKTNLEEVLKKRKHKGKSDFKG